MIRLTTGIMRPGECRAVRVESLAGRRVGESTGMTAPGVAVTRLATIHTPPRSGAVAGGQRRTLRMIAADLGQAPANSADACTSEWTSSLETVSNPMLRKYASAVAVSK